MYTTVPFSIGYTLQKLELDSNIPKFKVLKNSKIQNKISYSKRGSSVRIGNKLINYFYPEQSDTHISFFQRDLLEVFRTVLRMINSRRLACQGLTATPFNWVVRSCRDSPPQSRLRWLISSYL